MFAHLLRRALASVLLIALLSMAARSACAADWPQWLGPARNGVSTEVVPLWKEAPKEVWKSEQPNGYSTPIVADGIVFLHGKIDDAEAEEVTAFDALTGKPLWHDTYERARYRSIFGGSGPRTTPTYKDGKLYTFGITGVLTCYEAKTGKRLWQHNPYDVAKTPLPRWGVCASPVVAGGKVAVLVGGGGYAYAAYDANTGELAWKGADEPAGTASPTLITRQAGPNSDPEFVVQTTLRLLGVSPSDGKIRWEHPVVFQPAGVAPTPLFIENTLVCTTPETGTLALALPTDSASAPKQLWHKSNAASYFSTGTLGPKGSVLVVTNQLAPVPRADLTCFDLQKGDQLWKQEGVGYYQFGSIMLADGKLLVLDDAGNLILAEVTREGYKELAKTKVCGGTLSNPSYANGKLYVRDDKALICLQLGASP